MGTEYEGPTTMFMIGGYFRTLRKMGSTNNLLELWIWFEYPYFILKGLGGGGGGGNKTRCRT